MATFELERFVITANRIWQKAREENRLTHDSSDEELRRLVEKQPGVRKTIHGNFVAQSEPISRSATFTKNSVDYTFGENEPRLLAQCEKALGKESLISVDRVMGNESSNTTVRLIVPEQFAHVAYGGKNLFIPPKGKVGNQPTKSCSSLTRLLKLTNRSPSPRKISLLSDWLCWMMGGLSR